MAHLVLIVVCTTFYTERMDKKELKYQDQDYFNDTYLFDVANRPFQSKAHFEKGYALHVHAVGRVGYPAAYRNMQGAELKSYAKKVVSLDCLVAGFQAAKSRLTC